MTISHLQHQFEEELKKSIPHLGCDEALLKATSYSLLNGGKRVRPLIVLSIAQALNSEHNVMPAALSVEYFHTASLIADDLPCMDNDDYRREKLALHKAFPENIALLSSYGLISAAFEQIALAARGRPQLLSIALEEASKASGFKGATSGQFYDLYAQSPSLEELEKIYAQKTITLFEIAFLFGWIFGGGKLDQIKEVKQCAYHYGFAFQLFDDLGDREQDSLNMVPLIGEERAVDLLQEHVEHYKTLLDALAIRCETLLAIAQPLSLSSSNIL